MTLIDQTFNKLKLNEINYGKNCPSFTNLKFQSKKTALF